MNKVVDLNEKLTEYRYEYDLLQKIPFSKAENKVYKALLKAGQPLPEGVYRYKNVDGNELDQFYTIYAAAMDDKQVMEYLTYKKLDMLRTIKNCVVFFTVLAVISLVCGFLLSMSLNGMFR